MTTPKKNYFQEYLSDPEWLITETAYDPNFRLVNESQFTLGNGYIGSRGIYEEMPSETSPGTFFAGIFDPAASKVSELVNAPNPFAIYISARDEKLNIDTMAVKEHKRILDMRRGLLYRHTVFSDFNQRLIDYQSIRFISMHNHNMAVLQVVLSPLTENMRFTIYSTLDTSVSNYSPLTEGSTRHFYIDEAKKIGNIHYTAIKTLAHNITIAYAEQLFTQEDKTSKENSKVFEVELKTNETILITKIITFFTSNEIADLSRLKQQTININRKMKNIGVQKILKKHIQSFEKKWQLHDIKIDGDAEVQSALRFNLYHLIIAANPHIKNVSIGARALTGEGYRGHIFWETELFMLPCYLYTNPLIARNLLEYRFNRLPAAEQIALSKGYKGAMYPWESADTGLDETPTWSKDFDGTIKFIRTGAQSQHITADIFYAIFQYFQATDDVDFLLKMGLRMVIQIARFWKSRIEHKKINNKYSINQVIGPDEFHENINNNFYTNFLVMWTLLTAAALVELMEQRYPKEVRKLLKKMNLTLKERKRWETLAYKLFLPNQKIIFEQFEGFFELKNKKLPSLDAYGLPTFPKDVSIKDLYLTQFIKQPDVVMSLFLFPEFFNRERSAKNYRFYEKRTLHKSSLSPPIYSLVGAQLAFDERAAHYLNVVLNSDKKNIYGNTRDGMHAASVGGSWLSVVYGFCGVRVINDMLVITPNFPPSWQCVKLNFFYLDFLIYLEISKNEVQVSIKKAAHVPWLTSQKDRPKRESVAILVQDQMQLCFPNKTYIFQLTEKLGHYDVNFSFL